MPSEIQSTASSIANGDGEVEPPRPVGRDFRGRGNSPRCTVS